MITSRNIEDLDPKVQPVCVAHRDICAANGIDTVVTATFRDADAQHALYLIGRSGPEDLRKHVTDSDSWQSWHQFKCAWDLAPLIHGKIPWDDESIWKEMAVLGEKVGAEAGAHWTHFPDRPHFQFKPAWMTLGVARQMFNKTGTIFI